MLEEVAPELWVVAHDVFLPGGIHFPGRMTVVRLPDGGLWLHSPVPISDALAAALAELGPVRHLVAPNQFHNLFLGAAAARYPAARVHLAPGLRERLPHLPEGEVLQSGVAWQEVLEGRLIEGMPRMAESVFLHRPSATLICTDLVFHFEASNWMTGLLLWMVGARGRMATSRSVRLMTKDPAAARRSLEAVLAWPFERVLMAHGAIVEVDARARLAEATSRLRGGVTELPLRLSSAPAPR